MQHHDVSVARGVDVELQHVGTCRDGGAERGHGVLGGRARRAAVTHDAAVSVRLGSSSVHRSSCRSASRNRGGASTAALDVLARPEWTGAWWARAPPPPHRLPLHRRNHPEAETVRYEGKLYRPPSEADALIVQATIGCSWNHCTYCDMYRDKRRFGCARSTRRSRTCAAARKVGTHVEKVFVADGDALVLPMDHWRADPRACRARCSRSLRRVSAATPWPATSLGKTDAELAELARLGLSLLYIGPESGDDDTLRGIAKGDDAAAHVEAARRARAAGMSLGDLPARHRRSRAGTSTRGLGALATAMDPRVRLGAHRDGRAGYPARQARGEGALRRPRGAGAAARAAPPRRTRAPDRRRVPHQPRLELPAARGALACRRAAHPFDDRRGAGWPRGSSAIRVGARALTHYDTTLIDGVSVPAWFGQLIEADP